ncbi:MAG: hypothetical protein FWD26_01460 [Treponema sp.]|nr:hypothetical protein [Treponema sp.]
MLKMLCLKQIKKCFFLILVFLIVFAACEVGLGSMVNTDKPQISIPDDNNGGYSPGSFIKGDNIIMSVNVVQPFGMREVFMTIWYADHDGGLQTMIVQAAQENDLWYVNFDSTLMQDGEIRAKITAIDISGNTTVTTDIIYFVKNNPPELELSIPKLYKDDFDAPNLNVILRGEPVARGSAIIGIVTDLCGIAKGYPQIMIWPAENNSNYHVTRDPVSGFPVDEVWGKWRTMADSNWQALDKNQASDDKIKAVQARWPLVQFENGELPDRINQDSGRPEWTPLLPGDYNFVIKVKDRFSDSRVDYYPNRIGNIFGIKPEENEIKFMTISVIDMQNPVISIGQFPEFYDLKNDFEAELIIQSLNVPLKEIKAGFSNELNHHTAALSGNYIHEISAGLYKIIIPASDIKRMLGCTVLSCDVSGTRWLLVSAVDSEGNLGFGNERVMIDAEDPLIDVFEPQGFWQSKAGCCSREPVFNSDNSPVVTGSVVIRGSSIDNMILKDMVYAIGREQISAIKGSYINNTPVNRKKWADSEYWLKRENHPDFAGRIRWSGAALSSWTLTITDIADFFEAGKKEKYLEPYIDTQNPDNVMGKLPFMLMAEDTAGHFIIIEAALLLDRDGDAPRISFTTHKAYKAESDPVTVGGTVIIGGMAEDNEWIHSIEIRIRTQAVTNGHLNTVPIMQSNGVINPMAVLQIMTPNNICACHGALPCDKDGKDFIPVDRSGSPSAVISWFHTLNGDIYTYEGELRQVLVEVRAKDASLLTIPPSPKNFGPAARLLLQFHPGVPDIDADKIRIIHGEDWWENRNNPSRLEKYNSGVTSISGFKVLKIIIEDKEGIELVRLRNWSGLAQNWSDSENYITARLYSPSLSSAPQDFNKKPFILGPQNTAGKNRFELYIPLDSNGDLRGGAFKDRGGIFSMEIEVENAEYRNQTSISVQIDNFYPVTNFRGSTLAVGADYEISGRAFDTMAGINTGEIEKVVVYFSTIGTPCAEICKNPCVDDHSLGKPVSLTGNAAAVGAFINTQSARRGRFGEPMDIEAGIKGNTLFENRHEKTVVLPFFPALTKNADGTFSRNENAIVIDRRATDRTSSNYDPSVDFRGDAIVSWSAIFDSAKMNDGKYNLHFAVFDTAGNVTHNYREIYAANNRPVIAQIDLGTDINGTGSIGDSIRFLPPFASPDFRVQNNRFNLAMRLEDKHSGTGIRSGNGSIYYRFYHVQRASNITQIQRGKIYTIQIPGNTEWFNLGAVPNANNAAFRGVTFIANKNAVVPAGSVTGYTSYENTNINTRREGMFDSGDTFKTAVIPEFGDSAFGNAPLISDSEGIAVDETGKITWKGEKLFILHVYDTTVPSGDIADQLSHIIVLNVGINNNDTIPPVISSSPFGFYYRSGNDNEIISSYADRDLRAYPQTMEGYNENIVMESTRTGTEIISTGIRKGYVQYAADSYPGTNAYTSGMVIFNGKAMDNERIQSLSVRISFMENGSAQQKEFVIAEFRDGKMQAAQGHTIDKMRLGIAAADSSNLIWGFEAVDEIKTMEYGHVLNWKFAWDTSTINGINKKDVTVAFIAHDSGFTSAVQTKIDIVPYITELVTPLSSAIRSNPSAFNRSALGWYPVRENDIIQIKGFNFSLDDTTAVMLGNIKLNINPPLPAGIKFPARSKTHINANIGTVSESGELKVTVNNIDSVNNTNNPRVFYNDEPNNVNNNKLTDDRYIYVWNTGFLLNQRVIQSPFMRMSKDSVRYMSYGDHDGGATASSGKLRRRVDNTTTTIESWYNRYSNTAIAIDEADDWYAASSNITAQNYPCFSFYARLNAGGSNNAAGNNKRRIMQMAGDPDRVKIPRIFVQNTNGSARANDTNAARIFLGYSDNVTVNNPLLFHYGIAGHGNANVTWGGQLTEENYNTTVHASAQIVAHNTTKHAGSIYSAVGALSNGLPVIAWYDKVNQNLVLSHGGSVNENGEWNSAPLNGIALSNSRTVSPPAVNIVNTQTYRLLGGSGTPADPDNGTWQGNARIVHESAGSHVDMAVDGYDNIHLAYFNVLSGGLWYAFIPAKTNSFGAKMPDMDKIKTVRVDTYLSAGTKIMINVRYENGRYVPYISSFHASFAETKNSIRVAWQKDPVLRDGTDLNDRFTGAWEVMTVAAGEVPLSDEFVCNGVPVSGYLAAPGDGSALKQRAMSKTILVCYMTDKWYEGAVLKYNIW